MRAWCRRNGMSHQRPPESPSACASGFPGLQVSSPVAPRSCPHSGAAPGVQNGPSANLHSDPPEIYRQSRSMQHARKQKTYLDHAPRYPRVSSPMAEGLVCESTTLYKRRGPSWGNHLVACPYSQILPWVIPMGVGCWWADFLPSFGIPPSGGIPLGGAR